MQITQSKKPKARLCRIHKSEIELILRILNYGIGDEPACHNTMLLEDFSLLLKPQLERYIRGNNESWETYLTELYRSSKERC